MHVLPKNIEVAIIKAYIDQKYHKYLQPENIACFKELPSTNSYLLECANKKNNSLIFCLAEKQTAGRGRRNRIWESPNGNIYLSILFFLSLIPFCHLPAFHSRSRICTFAPYH